MTDRQKDRLFGVVAVVGLVLGLVGLVGLAWAVDQADRALLQWWALLATVAGPLGGLVGYWLGKTEARGLVAGLDRGTGQVMKAAQDTAAIRVGTARALRSPTPPAPAVDPGPLVIIPAPVPSLGAGRGDDVLLLE